MRDIVGTALTAPVTEQFEGKGSPITSERRRRVAGYARHFSVSQNYDSGAYLLSVAVLPSLVGEADIKHIYTVPLCHH